MKCCSVIKYVVLATSAFAQLKQSALAQNLVETSAETRFQLDCHVPDTVLQAMLPAGFSLSVAAQGPAKDANLRVVFIDRISVRGPNGKALGTGSSQVVYLVAPVKDTTGAEAQLVLGGISTDPADVTGPYGVYLTAQTFSMHRSVESSNGPATELQDWNFATATGEHFEMHVQFERGIGFKIPNADVKFYSAKNPGFYRISHQELELDILRNVTTTPPDRVTKFSFKAGGGSYARLFDGKEKLLSWDNILWINRTVMLPQ
jgi:hypothetical protein